MRQIRRCPYWRNELIEEGTGGAVRPALAPLLAKLVQAANSFLAVRRLGDSRGQIGRSRGLTVIVDAVVLKGRPGQR